MNTSRLSVVSLAVVAFGAALAQEATRSSDASRSVGDAQLTLAVAAPAAAESLEQYAGAYVTRNGVVFIVVAEDRYLTIEAADDAAAIVELFPRAQGAFAGGGGFVQVEFERDAAGRVSRLRIYAPSVNGLGADKAPERRGVVTIEDVTGHEGASGRALSGSREGSFRSLPTA